MIRARTSTRDALRELAEAEQLTLIETLDRVVRSAHEARLLAALGTSLAEHAHAVAAETKELDSAFSSDGLSEDDFSDW